MAGVLFRARPKCSGDAEVGFLSYTMWAMKARIVGVKSRMSVHVAVRAHGSTFYALARVRWHADLAGGMSADRGTRRRANSPETRLKTSGTLLESSKNPFVRIFANVNNHHG